MKKYYYTDGTNNYGPFSMEELKEKNISRDTLVWFQGLSEWKRAVDIAELKGIFFYSPPPLKKEVATTNVHIEDGSFNQNQPPKTWLLESILATLFCCLPFGIAGIVNAAKVESRFYAGDIEGAKRASQEAGKWTKVSFWIGVIVGGLYVLVTVISVASGF